MDFFQLFYVRQCTSSPEDNVLASDFEQAIANWNKSSFKSNHVSSKEELQSTPNYAAVATDLIGFFN